MKRVFFGCDPVGKSVIWEEGGFMSVSGALPIAVSDELRRSLLDWNDRMGVLVRTPERYSQAELLATRMDLNEEGERLARRIEDEQNGQVDVQYREE
nr:hypothetical protein [Sphingomonas sp.]